MEHRGTLLTLACLRCGVGDVPVFFSKEQFEAAETACEELGVPPAEAAQKVAERLVTELAAGERVCAACRAAEAN